VVSSDVDALTSFSVLGMLGNCQKKLAPPGNSRCDHSMTSVVGVDFLGAGEEGGRNVKNDVDTYTSSAK
jgi:hypothetical protein